jgi:hypothetical protein
MSITVSFGKSSFEVNSGLLELFLRLAALHIESPVTQLEQEIRDDWLFISSGGHSEILCPDFDSYLYPQEGKVIALSAIGSLLIALKNAPKQLNKDMLNVMGFKYIYVGDVNSEALIALGEACIDLINGRDRS